MLAKLLATCLSFRRNIEGATAIEYGLIAGGISLAIIAAVFAFGDDLETMFNTIGNAMDGASTDMSTELPEDGG